MGLHQDPEAFYLSRLGPSLLSRKLTAYGTTCRAIIKAQAESGNNILASWGEDFSFDAYLDSIKDVLTLPINRTLASAKQFILETCAFQSLKAARALHESIDDLFIGFFPIDLLTVTLIRTSPKKFLILVNEGIVHLLFRAGLLAVKAMEQSEQGAAVNQAVAAKLADDLVNCFAEYAAERPFPSGRSLTVSPEGTFAVDRIVQWSLRFICAHELGHIVQSDASEPASTDSNAHSKIREEEFQADKFAFRCLRHGVQMFPFPDQTISEVRLGVILFFHVVALNETFSRATDEPLLNTHPPAADRLAQVRRQFRGSQKRPPIPAHAFERFFESIFQQTHQRMSR